MQESRSLIGWVDPRLEGLRRPTEPGRTPGLCRAISHRTGLDLTLVRALFILLSLSTGVGIMLYGWGTVLSAGSGGRRPIDSLLPSFARWSLKTQAAVVVLSSLAFSLTFGQMAPLSFVVAVVILILLYAATSTARSLPMPPPPPPGTAPRSTTTDFLTAAERAHSIDDWRAAMQQAGRHPAATLPELDLYGPQPEPVPPRDAPRAKTSWGAATGILLTGAVTFTVAWLLGGMVLPFALGITAAAMGVLTLLLALVARQIRIPRLALGIVAAFACAAIVAPPATLPPVEDEASAFTEQAGEEFPPPFLEGEEGAVAAGGSEFSEGSPMIIDVGPDDPGPIDLRELDLTGYTVDDPLIVEINGANASLTLELPGTVHSVTLNDEELEWNDGDDVLPISIQAYGTNLHITWETP